MKTMSLLLVVAGLLISATAGAQEMTALSCADFRPTPEAMERFPDLKGACEGIVERDGELYGLFRATVRRVSGNNVTLYLPATDHTFRVRPDSSQRVLIDGKKTRPRDLVRGQEIRIYLAVSEFARPDVQEIALVTESDVLVEIEVETVRMLPATASNLPLIALAGFILLAAGLLLRWYRLRAGSSLAVLIVASSIVAAPVADAETKTVQVPGKVTTSMVKRVAIVEAVNKETREIKVIDSSGRRFSFVAGDMVANFDQIEPRDRIVTQYLESIAIFVVPEGAPALPDAMAVELAPLGDKPHVAMADTFMVSATIEALNVSDRIVTLRAEDGSVRTVKLAQDVPLDKVDVGDEVRLRITEAIAISVVEVDS